MHLQRASLRAPTGWGAVLLGASLLSTACFSKSSDDDDDDDGGGGSSAAADYGPENTWYHASEDDVPADLAGTGYQAGDIAPNFTLVDQYGDEVELYQFYGKVVVLDNFTEW